MLCVEFKPKTQNLTLNTAFSLLYYKGMFYYFHLIQVNTDYVKPYFPLEAFIILQVKHGRPDYVPLLLFIDCNEGTPKGRGVSPFYLYEDKVSILFSDNIDLTKEVPVVSLQYPVALFFEGLYGNVFTLFSFFPFTQHNALLHPGRFSCVWARPHIPQWPFYGPWWDILYAA